ncbi:hypothetical protein HanIR_Chr02g0065941 [Helianthus annuus]|nr:hypothetical protein HanIR_Chr02g0065941 [Helianthus annuus]
MAWRFKDHSMDFELRENFVFNQNMARDLIDNRSPIRPLPKHIFLLDRVSHFWDRGDKEWPMICRNGEGKQFGLFSSFGDALNMPNFANLDFDFVEEDGDGEPFIKKIAPAAYEIRPPVDSKVSSKDLAGPESGTEMAGSSRVQVTVDPLVINKDSDPEIQDLNRELKNPSLAVIGKGKATSSSTDVNGLVHRKRKIETHQINPKDVLPLPKTGKKTKRAQSSSTDQVFTHLTEHLSGGRSSREETAKARSAPVIAYSGFLPVDDMEEMKTEDALVTSKGEGKVVSFSGTVLGPSFGPDYFLEDDEDQVSSLPSSWFGPEVMTFFRYADVFS